MIAAGEADDLSGLILITDAKAAPKGGLMRIEVSEDQAQGLVDMLTRLIATRRQRRKPVSSRGAVEGALFGDQTVSEAMYADPTEPPAVPMLPASAPRPALKRGPWQGPTILEELAGGETAESAAARDEREVAARAKKEAQEKRRARAIHTRGNALEAAVAAEEDVAE